MDFTQVGVVVKPHGLKGALVVKMEAAYADQLASFEQCFLKQSGTYVPYALEEVSALQADKFKVVMRGVTDVQLAESFRGMGVYQDNDLIRTEDDLELEGFSIYHASDQYLGNVVQVIENKAQLLLVIENQEGHEFMVPLVEAFIVSSNPTKKTMLLDLPEGLLDL